MAVTADIIDRDDCLIISGDLNFSTVVDVWKRSHPFLTKKAQLSFDFSQIAAVNSAGLALLIEWKKYAKKNNKTISFRNIPKQLLSIAAISGVEGLLSAENNKW